MHFRSLLFNGLLASAVLFFPADTFAENDGESVKADPNEKAVEAASSAGLDTEDEKMSSEQPGREPRIKGNSAEIPAKPEHSGTAENKKNVQLPDQASGEAEQAVKAAHDKAEDNLQQHDDKRAGSARQPAAPKKSTKAIPQSQPVQSGTDNGEHKGQTKENKSSEKGTAAHVKVERSSEKTLHNIDSTKEKLTDRNGQKKKHSADESLPVPENNTRETVEYNGPESGESPSELPDRYPADAAVFSSQVNSASSAGSSKDRTTGNGPGTSAWFDKWLELNVMTASKVILPYFSGSHIYFNQWMNAPPSPPPEHAPFLKNDGSR
ncbi:hypothetical protein [Bacillus marinisedimentorum]|uniref:hypothetical protein n=1 Tax=Bacillus marinisedimentorum TaxID=1821260 RepID=UPI0008734541|nr:hypothetical protein [Bacillus marinisedimentorum]